MNLPSSHVTWSRICILDTRRHLANVAQERLSDRSSGLGACRLVGALVSLSHRQGGVVLLGTHGAARNGVCEGDGSSGRAR